MTIDDHIRRGHPILFGLLILFGIVEGSITTWITVQFNRNHNYDSVSIRDRVMLLVFTSWWTVFFSFVFILLFLHSRSGILTSVASHLIFLSLTWILWTAGVGSLTASLGGGINCSKVERNVVYCNQLNAAMGFGWVEWLLVTALLVIVLFCGVRSFRRGDGARGQLIVA